VCAALEKNMSRSFGVSPSCNDLDLLTYFSSTEGFWVIHCTPHLDF